MCTDSSDSKILLVDVSGENTIYSVINIDNGATCSICVK